MGGRGSSELTVEDNLMCPNLIHLTYRDGESRK
jgi:hypothetical protein